MEPKLAGLQLSVLPSVSSPNSPSSLLLAVASNNVSTLMNSASSTVQKNDSNQASKFQPLVGPSRNTGDIVAAMITLFRLLKKCKSPPKFFDEKKIIDGQTEIFLQIIHFIFFDFSAQVVNFLNSNNSQLFYTNDKKFIQGVFKLMYAHFDYQAKLTVNQFLAVGCFVESKILFCCDVIRIVLHLHNEQLQKKKAVTYTTPVKASKLSERKDVPKCLKYDGTALMNGTKCCLNASMVKLSSNYTTCKQDCTVANNHSLKVSNVGIEGIDSSCFENMSKNTVSPGNCSLATDHELKLQMATIEKRLDRLENVMTEIVTHFQEACLFLDKRLKSLEKASIMFEKNHIKDRSDSSENCKILSASPDFYMPTPSKASSFLSSVSSSSIHNKLSQGGSFFTSDSDANDLLSYAYSKNLHKNSVDSQYKSLDDFLKETPAFGLAENAHEIKYDGKNRIEVNNRDLMNDKFMRCETNQKVL